VYRMAEHHFDAVNGLRRLQFGVRRSILRQRDFVSGAQPSAGLPLVWILSTGGTIAGKGSSSTDLTNYKPAFLGQELVAAVPEIKQHAQVAVEQIVNVRGPNITLENWLMLGIAWRHFARPSLASWDTWTRTRSASTRPARNGTQQSPSSTSEISNSSRPWTSCTHTCSRAQSRSRHLWKAVWKGSCLPGLVLQKMLLQPQSKRPVLVRSNRTGNGRVVARDDYDRMHMIPADTLSPQKARILLTLALTRTRDLAEIRRMYSSTDGARRSQSNYFGVTR